MCIKSVAVGDMYIGTAIQTAEVWYNYNIILKLYDGLFGLAYGRASINGTFEECRFFLCD